MAVGGLAKTGPSKPDLHGANGLEKVTVSFCFDDGYADNYDLAFPLFREYGMAATTFVIAGRVGDYFESHKLMDWQQIEVLNRAGWEIGSHSMTHPVLTELKHVEVDRELKQSKEILTQHGIVAAVFAVPYGKYNEDIRKIAAKYYRGVRASVSGLNLPHKLDPYELRAMWTIKDTSVDEIKSWLNESDSVKNRSWLIIGMHHVEERKTQEYTISKVDLEMLLKHVSERDIEVRTIGETLSRFRSPQGLT